MNILQRLFHRHKWETIAFKKLDAVTSDTFPKTRPGAVIVRSCAKCNEEDCYITDGINRTTLDRGFVKIRYNI